MSEVGLTPDQHPFRAVSLLLFLLLLFHAKDTWHFYAPAILEVTWYEPLYNIYIYIYIYMCVYIYIYIYIYLYIYIYTHTCIYTDICIKIYTYMCIYMCQYLYNGCFIFTDDCCLLIPIKEKKETSIHQGLNTCTTGTPLCLSDCDYTPVTSGGMITSNYKHHRI